MQQRWRDMQATLEGLQARVNLHLPEGAISSRCGSGALSLVLASSRQTQPVQELRSRGLHRGGGWTVGSLCPGCGDVTARCCAHRPHSMHRWQGRAACPAAALGLKLRLKLPHTCCTEGGAMPWTGEMVSAAWTGSQQPLTTVLNQTLVGG